MAENGADGNVEKETVSYQPSAISDAFFQRLWDSASYPSANRIASNLSEAPEKADNVSRRAINPL